MLHLTQHLIDWLEIFWTVNHGADNGVLTRFEVVPARLHLLDPDLRAKTHSRGLGVDPFPQNASEALLEVLG